MSTLAPYAAEIAIVNAEVQAWFNGTADPTLLDRLMAHFSADFSMVMPDGTPLDKPALRQIFDERGGLRPHLTIAITEIALMTEWDAGAVATYVERQDDGAGNRNARRSTVIFARDAEGRLSWRHLHETFFAD